MESWPSSHPLSSFCPQSMVFAVDTSVSSRDVVVEEVEGMRKELGLMQEVDIVTIIL